MGELVLIRVYPLGCRHCGAQRPLTPLLAISTKRENSLVRIRQLEPATSVSHLKAVLPFRRPEDMARLVDGLRARGYPNDRAAPPRRHRVGRRRRLLAADGPRRKWHLGGAEGLRREVVDPRIAKHNGRIVKTTGDGLLLEFASVVDAVRCVIEVQTAMAEKTADVPEDRRIAFRIGVNVGDIIIDGDDIFGDGVNIAARLQEIAPPGGLCMSGRAHDDVRDRLDVSFAEMGAQTLKNIARPVPVWSWSPDGCRPRLPPLCPGAARQAVDCRAAVPEHVRRSRAGVFRRRNRRGHHHRLSRYSLALRDRPQPSFRLQGQSGRI